MAEAQAPPPARRAPDRAPPPDPRRGLAASPRVIIDTPSLTGSIALKGARIDDLFLKGYHEEVAKTSPLVELLRPEGMADAYFAELGWVGANLPGLPDATPSGPWPQGRRLAPGQPVVLTYANGQGLTFTRTIAVDDKYMFTVTDTVANQGRRAGHPGALRLGGAPGPSARSEQERPRPRRRHRRAGLDPACS